jgi:hypothetical protein
MEPSKREKVLVNAVRVITAIGLTLPFCYVLAIAASDLSNQLARLDVVGWMQDFPSLLSVPWEVLATLVVIVRWRDLPQRFWILYCVNGFLAYASLPIYMMHFGILW